MIKLQKVYVKTNSYNLWWGIYGLGNLTGWEDIVIFDDIESANKLGSTCICTKDYLGYDLEELEEDPEEKDFVNHIKEYLKDNQIHYHYYYDDPADDDFYQLRYSNLPLNDSLVKPRSIEMWHPNKGIDLAVIEECVKVFCQKFLSLVVDQVHFIDPVNIDKATQSYKEHLQSFKGSIVFSDNLIDNMMNKLSKNREEVLRILNNSVKQ